MDRSDIPVKERSLASIAEIAGAFRDLFGFGNQQCPDLLWAVENELSRYIPQFAVVPVRDGSIGSNRCAEATFNPHRIKIEDSGYKRLREYDPNARDDLGHELGHFALHYDGERSLSKYRTMGNIVYVKNAGMSAEKQADFFSLNLLAPANVVADFATWEEVAHWCKVPAHVAKEAIRRYGRRLPVQIPDSLKTILRDLS